MSKNDYFDYHIRMATVEGNGVDLIAMGRPEGQGCYCAANSVMRTVMDRISANYDFVVMDNEAGMEHLSRRTTRDVDILLIVSDPTQRGIVAAQRVADLVDELAITVKECFLIVNRLPGDELPAPLQDAVARSYRLTSPVDEEMQRKRQLAPGLPALHGAVAGFLDNRKGNADHLLGCLRDLLRARFDFADVVWCSKFIYSRTAEPEVLEELASRCQFVVTAIGD